MAEFREDSIVYPLMIELSACLCAEITASGLPEPCFCGLVPGTESNIDTGNCKSGKCGAAWVRLDTAYPSNNLEVLDLSAATSCAHPIAFVLEVGITRCFNPYGTTQGAGQGVAANLEATRLQLADMAAMRRAIQCCMGAHPDRQYALGQYLPITFAGGQGGGTWNVAIMQEF